MNSRRWLNLFVSALIALNSLALGCIASRAPINMQVYRQQLVAYHDQGDYERDMERVLKPAYRFLEREADSAERVAIVLDVDETTLSNWPQLSKSEFCYDGGEWAVWVNDATAEPIGPVLKLYQHARKLGYGVFFVTGRREVRRAPTEINLRAAGYDSFEALICKPDELKVAGAAAYKIPCREQIERDGWRIVLNVGDQQSDLDGGHAAMRILLPNPYYTVN